VPAALTDGNGGVAQAAPMATGAGADGELANEFSLPLMGPQSFLDLPLRSLTPEDEQANRVLQDDLLKQGNAVLGGPGGVRCACSLPCAHYLPCRLACVRPAHPLPCSARVLAHFADACRAACAT
jgi:hypothetical protein